MCGIVGAINGKSVVQHLTTGLSRLEYRGYDSAGLAIIQEDKIISRRAQGKLVNLRHQLKEAPLDGHIGIAHTRWATHGVPSVNNAHPHMTEKVAVVHNGIIENYRELRAELEANGEHFTSETDSEVIPRLITSYLEDGASPEDATFQALQKLQGSYALGIIFAGVEDRMIAARQGSPLTIGMGDQTNFIVSDVMALAGMANESLFLEDGDWATISNDTIEIRNANGALVKRPHHPVSKKIMSVGKGEYRHFMKKEIHEQPDVIRQTMCSYFNQGTGRIELPDMPFDFSTISKINIVACGTSFHAGLIAKYWIEKYAKLSVEVDTASEFRYREPLLAKDGVSLFISQSGETADSLAALRYVKSLGQRVITIVNVAESSMARESVIVLHTKAGQEIGVASTKAFTTQLMTLACLAIVAGRARNTLTSKDENKLVTALAQVPHALETLIENDAPYIKVAKSMKTATSAMFVGRGTAFPVAVEGALKLKEISYIHAEGYGAGELKHGPIALIEDKVPVVVVAPHDGLFNKTISNLQEISARGGNIILLSTQSGIDAVGEDVEHTLVVPECDPFTAPILYSVPLQMLAYHVAYLKGTDIDQPRNLAKSVTVE
ncbi:MAG: glutamine--fructose-6-phosphate transaminase (isomerizing) [Rhodospirillaceae bacterium]|nr:MAG: glutamine--fructose-6-phosphate transaminase (isomerizing) [Rhodospirillaceae bacterium]